MPTYLWRCPVCSQEVEVDRAVEERDTPQYCACQKFLDGANPMVPMHRVISAASLHFRGDGWTGKGP